MKSLTLRDIPEDLLEKARAIATRDRRSLNQSLILLIEEGLQISVAKHLTQSNSISHETQSALWEYVSGKWNDKKSTKKIISDIYSSRTKGREVKW